MNKIADIWGLEQKERDTFLATNDRFLTNIAEEIDFTVATVSRVFHRKINPDKSPTVKAAIERAYARITRKKVAA